jgi:hypothetical protein
MTSIEWLIEQYANENYGNEVGEQAKLLHKREITNAWDDGDYAYHYSKETGRDFENGEEYYNEKFLSKTTLKENNIETNEILEDVKTTTSDKIDGVIWSLPFEERMKCWDLIEELVKEETKNLYTEEQLKIVYTKGYDRGIDRKPRDMEPYIEFFKQNKKQLMKAELLKYCYKHQKDYVYDLSQRQFDSLILLVEEENIKNFEELSKYGMEYNDIKCNCKEEPFLCQIHGTCLNL